MPKTPPPPSTDLPEGQDLPEGPDLSGGPDLPEGPELGGPPRRLRGITADSRPMMAAPPPPVASGADILSLARRHVGEKYVLGARAPMANAGWTGPWDCAEFVSWCVYQAGKVLFGTEPRNDPVLADAFTGFWAQQAQQSPGAIIDWRDASGIVGAAVLRRPAAGQIGHIVISDGRGGTVEAHSTLRGVIEGTLAGRRWDCGILVPGIRYTRSDQPVNLPPAPADTLRLTTPLTQGERVRALQKRLRELDLPVGEADGIFGPQTAHAVQIFQARNGLVSDGEVGPATRKALKLTA